MPYVLMNAGIQQSEVRVSIDTRANQHGEHQERETVFSERLKHFYRSPTIGVNNSGLV